MIDRQTGAIANRDSKEVVWKEGLPCQGRDCPNYQEKKCQEVMNLQFLLPRVPGLGIWQIDTGSINSIRNINDNAAMLRAVCERVSWIPLTLTLEPKEVVNPDDGKKKLVRCLNIRHDTGLLEILAAKDKPRVTLLIPAPAEDQQPLDEIPDDEAIEGEVVPPTQPKKAARKVTAEVKPEEIVANPSEKRQAGIRPEQDEMEEGLNREGLTLTGTSSTKVKPEQADWRAFWEQAEEHGLSREQVNEMLGVSSVVLDWTDKGKTLDEAIEVISKKLAQTAGHQATTQPDEAWGKITKGETVTGEGFNEGKVTGEGFNIDLPWLKDSQKTLKWTDQTLLSFITSRYKVSGKTVTEALGELTREQAEEFTNHINARLEKQKPLWE